MLETVAPPDAAAQAAIMEWAAHDLGASPVPGVAPAGGRAVFRLPPADGSTASTSVFSPGVNGGPLGAGLALSEAFRRMEAAKERLGIQSFSLTQPKLAQVFLNVVGSDLSGDAE